MVYPSQRNQSLLHSLLCFSLHFVRLFTGKLLVRPEQLTSCPVRIRMTDQWVWMSGQVNGRFTMAWASDCVLSYYFQPCWSYWIDYFVAIYQLRIWRPSRAINVLTPYCPTTLPDLRGPEHTEARKQIFPNLCLVSTAALCKDCTCTTQPHPKSMCRGKYPQHSETPPV